MMSNTDDSTFNLDQEDRLPWLEAADDYQEEPSVSPARLALLVLGGLLLIGAIVGGMWYLQNGGRGNGELIAAPAGEYKVTPADPDAKVFEGEGDSSFAASEGAEPVGKVDASKVSEEPAITPAAKLAADKAKLEAEKAKVAAAKAATTAKAVVAGAAPAGKAVAGPTAKPAVVTPAIKAPATTGSASVQLGAFSSAASAGKAWERLSSRFSYLSGMSQSVAPATVGGKSVYRLRATAGSAAQAADVCNKLKVAGESCIIM